MLKNSQKENENSQAASEKNSFAAPSLSLPKGGGAIRGMGEKFAANPVTGTGSMSIPIATSPGRSGFGPQLSLSYDSGSGNGMFGFGWGLSLPAITRKTDKGLPQYLDASESDIFILSGAEDLVPEFQKDETGKWIKKDGKHVILDEPHMVNDVNYRVRRYRPRIEGLFARIERWSSVSDPSDVHWRSISKDNILTLYGKDENSRIFDPADKRRIFSWLICETRDDKGNGIIYRYQEEDGFKVDLAQAHERNRDDCRQANRYLKSIQYGNQNTLLDNSGTRPHFLTEEARANVYWMFEVVFDYDEDHYVELPDQRVRIPESSAWLVQDPKWKVRSDPFSTYRAGFEVRTYRRCRRVLMFHHFPVVAQNEDHYVGLVRSTDFTYTDDKDQDDPKNTVYSLIHSVTQSSYQLDSGDEYVKKSLPPVEFTYTQPIIQSTVHELQSDSLENLPIGIDGVGYQWIDLDGEGLSGILTEQAGGWFYKRNLSPINYIGQGETAHLEARFAPVELVATKPAFTLTRQTQFLDLAGDGRPDVVQFDSFTPGFYERTMDEGWEPFVTFRSLPTIDWNNPNLKFIDLNGDGHADILISEDNAFTWHHSLSEDGFGSAERVTQSWDEEKGPRVIFADGTESIYLSDMSGDGLTDIVRIRNGEVCYWPNLGYGHFGAKVTMDNSPWFDHPDIFDQKRIRLADIDGSGTVDILYLRGRQIDIYFNQCGNRWNESQPLTTFPRVDNLSSVQVLDLLGNGTACLVWGSPLPGDAGRPMRYIDLMGSQKPHLLIKVLNNLGAETEVQYAPSTKFYLQDKFAGNPWVTKLPFPVHCVEKVTVIDHWRKTKFSASYSYHHGYFDGAEREFRGFGRVEQVDVENYGEFAAGNISSPYITDDYTLYQPPVKTITWYHTGAFLDRERIISHFKNEYFPNWLEDETPGQRVVNTFQENILPEPDLEALDLSADEWREALRACKGMVLRQEIYELDVDALASGTHKRVRLFSTAYHNCHIQCLQPKALNPHAVFLVTESEAITYQYDLDLRSEELTSDPRIAHTLNLSIDEYGNIQQSVAVVYPRLGKYVDDLLKDGAQPLIQHVQSELHMAYTETRYTNDVLPEIVEGKLKNTDTHRLRVPCEVLNYELTGIRPEDQDDKASPDPRDNFYFAIDELRHFGLSPKYQPLVVGVAEIPYHQLPTQPPPQTPNQFTPEKRLVEHVRMLFFKDEADNLADTTVLQAPLLFGKLGRLGLPYETYKLALTKALLDKIFKNGTEDKLTLPTEGDISARQKLGDENVSGYLSGDKLADRFKKMRDDQSGTEPDATTIGQYWMRSGVAGFADGAAEHFYLPEQYTDPFSNITTLEYDARDLYIRSSTDSLYNLTEVTQFDFRVLAPYEMKDLNGNHTEAAFDILGRVIAVAVKGKLKGNQAWEGDNLFDFDLAQCNPSDAAVQAFCAGKVFDTARLAQARDWLSGATTRFVYHFGEKRDIDGKFIKWEERPAGACGIQREVHEARLATDEVSKFQVALECSDGAGNVLMKKVQAEPAQNKTGLRWIVSGKTVLNNKGKPVKQYEPYFSDDFGCTEVDQVGETPVMYYDAAGRLMRTELPDGTFSRVEFSPWHVKTFDANDTVKESRWYRERLTAAERGVPLHEPGDSSQKKAEAIDAEALAQNASVQDKRAARLAAHHADTPTLTILDSLGREVIAIAHNKSSYSTGGEQHENYVTFTKLDTEGKPLWIQDARGNRVMQYIMPPLPNGVYKFDDASNLKPQDFAPCYDIAGNLLYQHSMDAGDRWMLMDAAGKPMLAWDDYKPLDNSTSTLERRLYFTKYDDLHRPTAQWLTITSGSPGVVKHFKVELFEYRDTKNADGTPNAQLAADQAANLLGQLVRHYDPSGLVETVRRDFKGNVEEVQRRLNNTPQESLVDWHVDDPDTKLEDEIFTQITEYDALNRMTRLYNWHQGIRVAVYEPTYSERGVLYNEVLFVQAERTSETNGKLYKEKPGITLRNEAIKEIRYDAKGQKEYLVLGNGTITRYDYDPKTFRLRQLRTTRLETDEGDPEFPGFASDLKDGRVLQQLHYTYDPIGNITEIYDEAYEPVFFKNQEVLPRSQYTYDALYRLIEATGRESRALSGAPPHHEGNAEEKDFPIKRIQPTDPKALRNYTQRYHYDSVGNFVEMRHIANGGSWTRTYEPDLHSNRLVGTDTDNPLESTIYQYDTHGNMLNLAKVAPGQFLRWDHRDMIGSLDLQGGGWAYYQYDAGKQRTRKRIERSTGIVEDRIYLGGYELYRRYNGSDQPVEEIESHHLFEGEQRILLVDDVLKTNRKHPDGTAYNTKPIFRYQYSNHLGSACLELDDHADIISYEEYHPYGTSAYRAVKSGIEAPPKRYRYTGMERDEESGLNYHGARYYAAWLGRWVSCDPAGLTGGQVLYAYTHNNPILLIDITGHAPKLPKPPSPLEFTGWQRINQVESLAQSRLPSQPADKTDKQGGSASLRGLAFGITDLVEGTARSLAGLDEEGNFSLKVLAETYTIEGQIASLPSMFQSTGEDLGSGASMLVSGGDDEEAARRLARGIINTFLLVVGGSKTGEALSKKSPSPGAAITDKPQPIEKPKYETTPLDPAYKGENIPGNDIWPGQAVKYLSETERAGNKLEVRDGKLYDAQGNLFDTSEASSVHGGEGKAIFVMDAEGNIYASLEHEVGEFHHSSLLAGESVAAAGELRVKEGVLLEYRDASGHYHPATNFTAQFTAQLKYLGIDLTNVKFTPWDSF